MSRLLKDVGKVAFCDKKYLKILQEEKCFENLTCFEALSLQHIERIPIFSVVKNVSLALLISLN
jgi:hypothetical protein